MYPVAEMDDVTVNTEISSQATNDSVFVIHTGINDVCNVQYEELLEKYRRLTHHYKTKSNNIIFGRKGRKTPIERATLLPVRLYGKQGGN